MLASLIGECMKNMQALSQASFERVIATINGGIFVYLIIFKKAFVAVHANFVHIGTFFFNVLYIFPSSMSFCHILSCYTSPIL